MCTNQQKAGPLKVEIGLIETKSGQNEVYSVNDGGRLLSAESQALRPSLAVCTSSFQAFCGFTRLRKFGLELITHTATQGFLMDNRMVGLLDV